MKIKFVKAQDVRPGDNLIDGDTTRTVEHACMSILDDGGRGYFYRLQGV